MATRPYHGLVTRRRELGTDPDYLRQRQYRDPSNLNARIALHAKYSRADEPWYPWLAGLVEWPADGDVLEVGCGSGRAVGQHRCAAPTAAPHPQRPVRRAWSRRRRVPSSRWTASTWSRPARATRRTCRSPTPPSTSSWRTTCSTTSPNPSPGGRRVRPRPAPSRRAAGGDERAAAPRRPRRPVTAGPGLVAARLRGRAVRDLARCRDPGHGVRVCRVATAPELHGVHRPVRRVRLHRVHRGRAGGLGRASVWP